MHRMTDRRRFPVMVSLALVVAVGLVFAAASGGVAQSSRLPGKGKTFVLGYGMWTADNTGIYITKALLEDHLGYRVEVAELAIPALWAALADGQVHAFTNGWFPNHDYLLEAYRDRVDIVSTNFDDSTTGLIVPTWVAEEYGVRSWEDLFRPEIVRLFDQDRDGKGDLLGCDVAWTCYEHVEAKLKKYGLDKLYVQHPISEQMVNFQVQQAMRNREPLLWVGWTPGWLFAVYKDELTFLVDPWGYHPAAKEGTVKAYGWAGGTSVIVVNSRVRDEHPEAYRLLSQISIPLDDHNEWIHAQVQGGVTSRRALERYARQWIESNRELVDRWLEAAGLL